MTDSTTDPTAGPTTRRLAFVHHLDPLRTVQGSRTRYDCPDVATLDGHLACLRRRVSGARSRELADACRADIDRLLDRRAWLTLPVVA